MTNGLKPQNWQIAHRSPVRTGHMPAARAPCAAI